MNYLEPWQVLILKKVYRLAYPGLSTYDILQKMYRDKLIPENYFDLIDYFDKGMWE